MLNNLLSLKKKQFSLTGARDCDFQCWEYHPVDPSDVFEPGLRCRSPLDGLLTPLVSLLIASKTRVFESGVYHLDKVAQGLTMLLEQDEVNPRTGSICFPFVLSPPRKNHDK